ncbi:MAG: LacI family transcriptional regulator [Clostridiales bacterium]|nr:LacI family transcriptional regulator [Clostridiales bacterium]
MTIKDIARLSRYSVSTVSRALNDHPDINQDTKKKILKIARDNNFVPNSNAIRLKAFEENSVVIIVKGEFNLFFSSLIEHLQFYIEKSGFRGFTNYIHTSENEIQTAIRVCAEQKPKGIVFLGGDIENFRKDFERINIPCVLCTAISLELDYPNLSCISADDLAGGAMAIKFLLEKGHRNIGIIGGDISTECSCQLRYEGCLKGFEEYGLSFDTDLYEYSSFDFNDSYNSVKRLIKRHPEITAIFSMSDVMAIGASTALMDMGYSVPEDISVIGFDGIEISKFFKPKITTFIQPQDKIAKKSIELLTSMINGKKPARVLLQTKLIERESVVEHMEVSNVSVQF